MVLKEVRGKSHLFTGSPFVFIKGEWFDSIGLHALIFIGSTLLFLITLIAWSFSLVRGIKQKEKPKLPAIAGQFMAVLFGVGLLLFLVGFAGIFSNINPAYGVPDIYFNNPPGLNGLLQIPKVLAVLSVVMLIFSVLAWVFKYWSMKARVYYHLLTLSALAVVWALMYWNLLF
jgi:hypothetical protein